MLPTFPNSKKALENAVMHYMRARVREHSGVLSEIQRTRLFEGHRNILIRSDGVREATKTRRASGEFKISGAELQHVELGEVLQRADKAAESIARTQAQHMFETMAETVKKTGQQVDAGGAPFSVSLFLDSLEKMWIDFNPDGSPNMPTLTIHPSMADAVRKAFSDADSDPALQMRLARIIQAKKEEWLAREAGRELAG